MEGTAIALLAASGVILLALGVLLGRLLARGPAAPPPDLGSLSATLALLQEAARSHAQQMQELARSVNEIALSTGDSRPVRKRASSIRPNSRTTCVS
jgi:hypothetical protein